MAAACCRRCPRGRASKVVPLPHTYQPFSLSFLRSSAWLGSRYALDIYSILCEDDSPYISRERPHTTPPGTSWPHQTLIMPLQRPSTGSLRLWSAICASYGSERHVKSVRPIWSRHIHCSSSRPSLPFSRVPYLAIGPTHTVAVLVAFIPCSLLFVALPLKHPSLLKRPNPARNASKYIFYALP